MMIPQVGDDGDVALDAALAAADEDMLAAISDRLELDIGLADPQGPGRIISGSPGQPGTGTGVSRERPENTGRRQFPESIAHSNRRR